MTLQQPSYPADGGIDDIVRSLSPVARVPLVSLLGEAVNTIENLDVVCPFGRAGCRQYAQFQRLRQFLATLNEPVAWRIS